MGQKIFHASPVDVPGKTSDSLGAEIGQKCPEDPEKALSDNGCSGVDSLRGIQVKLRSGATGSPLKEVFVVGWEGEHDPLDPRNFSLSKRMIATIMVSVLSFSVGAASSITAAVLPQSSKDLNVSEVAGSLVTGRSYQFIMQPSTD